MKVNCFRSGTYKQPTRSTVHDRIFMLYPVDRAYSGCRIFAFPGPELFKVFVPIDWPRLVLTC